MDYRLWNLLDDLKRNYEWVELSHEMNNDSPVWSGIPEGSVEVAKTVFVARSTRSSDTKGGLFIGRPVTLFIISLRFLRLIYYVRSRIATKNSDS